MTEPKKDENVRNLFSAAEVVGSEANADVILFNGEIDHGSYRLLARECVRPIHENCFLILSTFGGNAHDAYRIARLLQRRYREISIFVPRYCKSAGTLITLSGNALIISDEGELGPLDVQVQKQDEIAEFGSGLATTQSFDFLQGKSMDAFRDFLLDIKLGSRVTTKMASDIATNLTIGLFAPIYQQIDAVRLGELSRSIMIADDYGKRLQTNNVKPETLTRLVVGYPSHSFIIDRDEAHELFHNVSRPTENQIELYNLVANVCEQPDQSAIMNLTVGAVDYHREQGDDDEDSSGRTGGSAAVAPSTGTGYENVEASSSGERSGDNVSKIRDRPR